MRRLTILLAGLAAPAALAQPFPNIVPAHDLTGTYQMTSPNNAPQNVTVEYSAAARSLRMTMPGGEGAMGYVLFDFGTHDAKMVMPQMQKYMDMAQLSAMAKSIDPGMSSPAPTPGAPPPDHYTVTKAGTEEIAGYECTVTEIADTTQNKWSKLCVTEDHVILGVDTSDGEHLAAQSISYAPVPEGDVEVPDGYTEMVMPGMPGGMGMPGAPPGQ
jgi:hypothetical protein